MLTNLCQPGVLAAVPALSRYMTFRLEPGVDPRPCLLRLADCIDGANAVVGIGRTTLSRLQVDIEGMHDVPLFEGSLEPVPSTPHALWLWLRGDDRGDLLHLGRRLSKALAPAFVPDGNTDGFFHAGGRDLTGYEDGTENPSGPLAVETALVDAGGAGKQGATFVAVQSWVHDLTCFERFPERERDDMIGRRHADNVELVDAPASSHVKRTAQGSFEPKALMLRRSMPWVKGTTSGLMFVAFARSFYAFEVQLRRMVGLEDGVVDALFRFSRPLGTSYYWCPPIRKGAIDLSALGI